MNRIGLFGGSFDPVHIGHLITASYVMTERRLEKIVFIPSFLSPFKVMTGHSDASHRMNMLRLAIDDFPGFEIDDIELQRMGVSFTIDTINEYHKVYDKVDLIIGYDNLTSFDKWKDPESIVEKADLVVLPRKWGQNHEPLEESRFARYVTYSSSPVIQISSTMIREKVKRGESIRFLTPPAVEDYIYTNNLFKV